MVSFWYSTVMVVYSDCCIQLRPSLYSYSFQSGSFCGFCQVSYTMICETLEKARHSVAKRRAKLKFSKPLLPTDCPHPYRSAVEMMSRFETHTRTLRYGLRSREIYIEERTPITSPEILTEPQETQDESVNTIQETPNSQFRLFLSVTPCMPRIDSEKSATCIPSPPLFSPPTGDSPQNQSPPPPPPLSPTTSLASTYNNSPELFSPTLSITPCMPRTVNCSPTLTSSLAHAPNSSPEHDETSSESPVLFSPTPTHSITVNKWPSPPPLPQRSPWIRRRHNLHNCTTTNGSCDVRSSVGAPPPDIPTSVGSPLSVHNINVRESGSKVSASLLYILC